MIEVELGHRERCSGRETERERERESVILARVEGDREKRTRY
jgi:hypothetical protein